MSGDRQPGRRDYGGRLTAPLTPVEALTQDILDQAELLASQALMRAGVSFADAELDEVDEVNRTRTTCLATVVSARAADLAAHTSDRPVPDEQLPVFAATALGRIVARYRPALARHVNLAGDPDLGRAFVIGLTGVDPMPPAGALPPSAPATPAGSGAPRHRAAVVTCTSGQCTCSR